MTDWSPASWRTRPCSQQPTYADEAELHRVLADVATLPPMVTSGEVEKLKKELAEVEAGARFLIQGGDCSERFEDCRTGLILNKLKVLLQMSLVLLDASKMKVTRVGRMAGQYAKPRSSPWETRGDVRLPAYQGDLVNRPEFTPQDRAPDPRLMIEAHRFATLTLNCIRGHIAGNFSDLDYPHYWDLAFAKDSPNAGVYQQLILRIIESLQFMQATAGNQLQGLTRFDFFVSHEALLLPFEQALTHQVSHRRGWYNLGTHFPWFGDRTRDIGGAHIEYARGIANPIGVKVGPSMTPDEIVALIEILNPDREPGRLTFIHRFGATKISAGLPPLIEAVKRSGRSVIWCCDPMHGNTRMTEHGYKTRSFDDILDEVRDAFRIHDELGTFLGGVHFEMTGEDVTECTGGARELNAEDLKRAYRSLVDPRLNHEQALEMALQVGQVMRKWRGSAKVKFG